MKKQLILCLLLIMYLLLVTPSLASAHFLQKQSGVGAILHVDPADDPAVGENATIYVTFTNGVTIKDCSCRLSILSEESSLLDTPLEKTTSRHHQAQASFVFPKKGVYTIVIEGKPRSTTNQFSPFRLEYDFRVDRDTTDKKFHFLSVFSFQYVHWGIYLFGLLCIIILIAHAKKNHH